MRNKQNNKIIRGKGNIFAAFEKKDGKHFKVVIFGSSRVKMYDNTYRTVRHLASMLG